MPYFSPAVLQPYLDKHLLSERFHPDVRSLRIYNYTHKCTYAKAWDDVTMHCRGLILDVEKRCVVKECFPKFFNIEEHVGQASRCRRKCPW